MSDLSNVIYVGNISGVAGQVIVTGSGVTNANVNLALSSTGVTPGVYGNATHVPQITVDSYGRVSNVSLAAIDIDPEAAGFQLGGVIDQVIAGVGLVGGGSASTVTLSIANTAVQAGTYGNASWVPELTINSRGQITNATSRRIVTGLSAILVDGKVLNTTANTVIQLVAGSGASLSANADTNTITIDANGGNITPGGQLDQVIAGVGLIQSGNSTVTTLSLANTAVTPGTYGSSNGIPRFTVNSRGQITNVVTMPVPTGLTRINVGGNTINVGAANDLTISGSNGIDIQSNAGTRTVTISGEALTAKVQIVPGVAELDTLSPSSGDQVLVESGTDGWSYLVWNNEWIEINNQKRFNVLAETIVKNVVAPISDSPGLFEIGILPKDSKVISVTVHVITPFANWVSQPTLTVGFNNQAEVLMGENFCDLTVSGKYITTPEFIASTNSMVWTQVNHNGSTVGEIDVIITYV